MQRVGGRGEGAVLDRREEVLELLESHRSYLWIVLVTKATTSGTRVLLFTHDHVPPHHNRPHGLRPRLGPLRRRLALRLRRASRGRALRRTALAPRARYCARGASALAPPRAPARTFASGAARGRRMGLRAEVRRVSRARLRRRRRRLPPVARKEAAAPLLPRAGLPRRALRPRRRDHHRRPGRAAGLQRPPGSSSPGGVARADARRVDPGDLRRLRPPRAGRREPAREAADRPPRRAGGAGRRSGAPGAGDPLAATRRSRGCTAPRA